MRAKRKRASDVCTCGRHSSRVVGSEAARGAVCYAFEVLRMGKLWARIDPRNLACARLLEKVGM